MPPRAAAQLGTMRWNNELRRALLAQANEDENRIVLRGKKAPGENTSGDTKIKAHGRIAREIIPEMHEINAKEAAKKVQTEYNHLVKKYGEYYRQLTATGSGIGGDDTLSGEDELEDSGNELREVEHACYIPPAGPDGTTTKSARNKWDSICAKFPLFAELHSMFCTRPSQVPIATTTGIGPRGPRTVLHQAPSRSSSSEWDLGLGPLGNSTAPNKPANNDSSDFEIIEPARSPSPAVVGNGKGTDPREHRPRPPKPAATQDSKAKVVAEKAGKSNEDVKVKVEGKKKEEKYTPPNPSTKLAAAIQSSNDSSGGSSGSRKRKSRDDGNILFAIHEGMQERHARLDARHEQDRSDAAYSRDMDRLCELRRIWPEMSMEEFRMREDAIRQEHGKPALVRPPLPTETKPIPGAGPQPTAKHPIMRPLGTSTSTNIPRTPSRRRMAAPVAQASQIGNDVIDITSSSPAANAGPLRFPFGTPVKQEIANMGDDGIFNIPDFPLDGQEPLFPNEPFGFAGPSA